VADTTTAKKRGRPKVFSDDYMRLNEAAGLFLDVKSTRGRQDIAYRLCAVHVLGDDPERFGWLCDLEGMERGEKKAWKPTILSELGRIPNDEELKEVASEICRIKPKTKDAVTMIRRYRTGKTAPTNVLDLTLKITRTIDEYSASHPDTKWQDVYTALEGARNLVEYLEEQTRQTDG
jgi:hypothetical protein